MPSPPPLLYNTCYHIFNRGVNRENIFLEERNYAHFLNLYAKYIDPVAETFAYCLLRNHFHLLIRTRTEEEVIKTLRVSDPDQISKHFSNFFNAYAKAINKAYVRTGSLFQHPFGRAPVTNSGHFYRLILYIHHNPQKHGFVEDYRDWKYSSYGVLLSDQPTSLAQEEAVGWFGDRVEFVKAHEDYVEEELDFEKNPQGLEDP